MSAVALAVPESRLLPTLDERCCVVLDAERIAVELAPEDRVRLYQVYCRARIPLALVELEGLTVEGK